MSRTSYPQGLKSRILSLMVLRVVLAIAFLWITTWFQLTFTSLSQPSFYPLYGIVACVGFLTILYAVLINQVKNLVLFTYLQISIDILLITVIVYITGGIDSYLSSLYLLSIIGSSILLSRRGGLYTASISSAFYTILIDMDYYRILPESYKVLKSPVEPLWEDVLTTIATNILAFFTMAYLAGSLAERTAKIEKKLEEKEIDFERLERLNRHIVENITSGIMTLDERGRITSFNKAAENITGYSLKDVYYRDVKDIFPTLPIGEGNSISAQGTRFEGKFKKKEGAEVYLGFTVSHGQGGDIAKIVIFQDLTQLKELEERLMRDEKLKALGELSAGIAHEIRNPLASISGSIQVLNENLKLSGENSQLMDIVLRETERLNSLITDFLLFAKPVQKKREMVNIGETIRHTLEVFRNAPEAKNINIICNMDDNIFVGGDARQLGQIFWNLFINAAFAMPQGGTLSVNLSLKRCKQDRMLEGIDVHGDWHSSIKGDIVEIRVSDTGTGIDDGDLKRIFDPFFSTRDSGTGLGLALVHRIVESHGGIIEVKSNPGRGTEFRILLPSASGQMLKSGGKPFL